MTGDDADWTPPTGLVRTRQRGTVVTLQLNRPEKYNAFNTEMVAGVTRALHDVRERDDVRALVLAAEGRAFAAGADIAEYAASDRAGFDRFTAAANAMCTELATLPVPVIAAVDGVALGGGFEVVLCCDLVVASGGASFGLPETSLGLIPGWGGTQALTGLIGSSRTKALVFSGDRLSADDAYSLGVVTEVCDTGNAVARAEELAADLTERAAGALAAAKRAVAAGTKALDRDGQGFATERVELQRLFDTEESREGIAAFVEKRRPLFDTIAAGRRPAPEQRKERP